ncbi:hypothetical protein EDD63_1625 [Breznakia blatticola]|uniref:Uncharacterized protein n=2 Tax=Breznakia blatticola TaxID=1754012 RepID=A0A4V3G631_9FIRM|nr:hypothetical protein EDD63_1625 [Breznakia blatticola]
MAGATVAGGAAFSKVTAKPSTTLDLDTLANKGTSGDSFDDWLKGMSKEDAARYNEWHNVRDAGYTMPWEDYLELRSISVKNVNGENMTLGKYFYEGSPDSYITKAQGTGDTYFDLGTKWNDIKNQYNLTDDDMFNLFNKPVLDDAVNAGKTIRFSQYPYDFKDTALWNEWVYLTTEHGYIRLIEEGGYWYAIK